jgi:hypothetical protein
LKAIRWDLGHKVTIVSGKRVYLKARGLKCNYNLTSQNMWKDETKIFYFYFIVLPSIAY